MDPAKTNRRAGDAAAQEDFGIGVDKLVSNPKSPSIQAQSPRNFAVAAVSRGGRIRSITRRNAIADALRRALERRGRGA